MASEKGVHTSSSLSQTDADITPSNAPEDKDCIEEMFDFFKFSRISPEYNGTCVFRIHKGKDDVIRSVRVSPGKPVEVFNGLPPDGKTSVDCSLSYDVFHQLYMNELDAKKAVLTGKVRVKYLKYGALSSFMSSFDLSTSKWDDYYKFKAEEERKVQEAETMLANSLLISRPSASGAPSTTPALSPSDIPESLHALLRTLVKTAMLAGVHDMPVAAHSHHHAAAEDMEVNAETEQALHGLPPLVDVSASASTATAAQAGVAPVAAGARTSATVDDMLHAGSENSITSAVTGVGDFDTGLPVLQPVQRTFERVSDFVSETVGELSEAMRGKGERAVDVLGVVRKLTLPSLVNTPSSANAVTDTVDAPSVAVDNVRPDTSLALAPAPLDGVALRPVPEAVHATANTISAAVPSVSAAQLHQFELNLAALLRAVSDARAVHMQVLESRGETEHRNNTHGTNSGIYGANPSGVRRNTPAARATPAAGVEEVVPASNGEGAIVGMPLSIPTTLSPPSLAAAARKLVATIAPHKTPTGSTGSSSSSTDVTVAGAQPSMDGSPMADTSSASGAFAGRAPSSAAPMSTVGGRRSTGLSAAPSGSLLRPHHSRHVFAPQRVIAPLTAVAVTHNAEHDGHVTCHTLPCPAGVVDVAVPLTTAVPGALPRMLASLHVARDGRRYTARSLNASASQQPLSAAALAHSRFGPVGFEDARAVVREDEGVVAGALVPSAPMNPPTPSATTAALSPQRGETLGSDASLRSGAAQREPLLAEYLAVGRLQAALTHRSVPDVLAELRGVCHVPILSGSAQRICANAAWRAINRGAAVLARMHGVEVDVEEHMQRVAPQLLLSEMPRRGEELLGEDTSVRARVAALRNAHAAEHAVDQLVAPNVNGLAATSTALSAAPTTVASNGPSSSAAITSRRGVDPRAPAAPMTARSDYRSSVSAEEQSPIGADLPDFIRTQEFRAALRNSMSRLIGSVTETLNRVDNDECPCSDYDDVKTRMLFVVNRYYNTAPAARKLIDDLSRATDTATAATVAASGGSGSAASSSTFTMATNHFAQVGAGAAVGGDVFPVSHTDFPLRPSASASTEEDLPPRPEVATHTASLGIHAYQQHQLTGRDLSQILVELALKKTLAGEKLAYVSLERMVQDMGEVAHTRVEDQSMSEYVGIATEWLWHALGIDRSSDKHGNIDNAVYYATRHPGGASDEDTSVLGSVQNALYNATTAVGSALGTAASATTSAVTATANAVSEGVPSLWSGLLGMVGLGSSAVETEGGEGEAGSGVGVEGMGKEREEGQLAQSSASAHSLADSLASSSTHAAGNSVSPLPSLGHATYPAADVPFLRVPSTLPSDAPPVSRLPSLPSVPATEAEHLHDISVMDAAKTDAEQLLKHFGPYLRAMRQRIKQNMLAQRGEVVYGGQHYTVTRESRCLDGSEDIPDVHRRAGTDSRDHYTTILSPPTSPSLPPRMPTSLPPPIDTLPAAPDTATLPAFTITRGTAAGRVEADMVTSQLPQPAAFTSASSATAGAGIANASPATPSSTSALLLTPLTSAMPARPNSLPPSSSTPPSSTSSAASSSSTGQSDRLPSFQSILARKALANPYTARAILSFAKYMGSMQSAID